MNPEPPKTEDRGDWKNDQFALREVLGNGCGLFPGFIVLVLILIIGSWATSLGLRFVSRSPVVIVYTAQDRDFAEPIFQQFTHETGIRVRPLYDSEATKTVGLANRLLAERSRPQCDVFWSNEELRTRQLDAAGLFRETNGWIAFGYRSRRLAVSVAVTNFPLPKSWLDLTNAIYRRKLAMAYPMFGTTCTHFLALRQAWGDVKWASWCRALAANQPFIVDGNSVAAGFVSRGEAWIGLTDSDDIAAEIRGGGRLRALPLSADSLLIPNTVAILRKCPHPEAANRLREYLQSPMVIQQLVTAEALEGDSQAAEIATTLHPDWGALLRDLNPATETMQQIFRR